MPFFLVGSLRSLPPLDWGRLPSVDIPLMGELCAVREAGSTGVLMSWTNRTAAFLSLSSLLRCSLSWR